MVVGMVHMEGMGIEQDGAGVFSFNVLWYLKDM